MFARHRFIFLLFLACVFSFTKKEKNFVSKTSIRLQTEKNPYHIEKTDSGLRVFRGSHPVLFYHTTTKSPVNDSGSIYRRSGFIHPVYTPGGKILTDDFPAGHTHHHGLFSAWVHTRFRNKSVDFWNQHQKTGTVAHASIDTMVNGEKEVYFTAKLRHISLEFGTVLEEKWKISFRSSPDGFIFDLFSEQTNTSTDTLFLLKYHYGGMAFRGRKEWNETDKKHFRHHWKVQTKLGLSDSTANHSKAGWVIIRGSGEQDGIAVFDHPGNLRYPQPIRVHPTMPYLVFSPVVEGELALAPGEKYRAQYRYFSFDSLPDKSVMDREEKSWHREKSGL